MPVARHGADCLPCSFLRLDYKGRPRFVGKGIAACHGLPQAVFLVWIVILGAFMVRTTSSWSGPFSILLYRDCGLSATLIGLILGPRRRFPTLVSFMAAGSRTNGGGATSCCFGCLVSAASVALLGLSHQVGWLALG